MANLDAGTKPQFSSAKKAIGKKRVQTPTASLRRKLLANANGLSQETIKTNEEAAAFVPELVPVKSAAKKRRTVTPQTQRPPRKRNQKA